ncbi:hypothetical protein LVY72_21085 [Arthrobacter sp. I2-34]|uniref:Meckel syndrome type 1 protein n=1 Tax=Arthrobacter hankyongi TaxID=2904801 RepID=A0ABS9LD28_9MICC|nr:hypothetical protein [Arthrobacter hankyongi]MCG2624389.1 hypothetical protein [Arthrobacter hankyongi]
MSQESQPPRSRREARLQARRAPATGSEQRGQLAVETPKSFDAVPAPSRTAGTSRADAGTGTSSGSAERASQARARDREARQTYNALTGALPKIEPASAPMPTRRQLRMQQLEREQGRTPTAAEAPAPTPAPTAASRPAPVAAAEQPAAPAAAVPDAVRKPDRSAVQSGRRDRRERRRSGPAADAAVEALSADEALAAREEVLGHAADLASMIEAEAAQDPSKVDLKLLAEQKALAERAAILNRRAADKLRLSQETKQGGPAADKPAARRDPVSAPMEFVTLPGSDRQVMRPAVTTYVPVATDPTPAQPAGTRGASRPAAATPQSGSTPPAKEQPSRSVPRTVAVPKAAPAAKSGPDLGAVRAAQARPDSSTNTARRTESVTTVKPAPKPSAAPATEPVSVVRSAAKPAAAGPTSPARPAPASGARSRLLAKAEAAAGGTSAVPPAAGTVPPAAVVVPPAAGAASSRRSAAPATRRSEAAPTRRADAPARRTERPEAPATRRDAVPTSRRTEAPTARATEAPATRRSQTPSTRRREVLSAAVVAGDVQPLRATRAHGLEPLDARTAGLAKANRDRLLVIGALAMGGLAFALGLIMMIIGLSN